MQHYPSYKNSMINTQVVEYESMDSVHIRKINIWYDSCYELHNSVISNIRKYSRLLIRTLHIKDYIYICNP